MDRHRLGETLRSFAGGVRDIIADPQADEPRQGDVLGGARLTPRNVLASIADYPINRIADLLPWSLTIQSR